MDASCKGKLMKARTLSEASKILETNKVKLGASAQQLLETAFAIKETQPQYANNFIATVIKETESAIDTENVHDTGVDKLKEGSANAGSEQSSSTDGLKDQGTDAPNSDIESMQTASGEDQMGKISENIGCPQGMDPSVYGQMQQGGGMPQMPQMNTPQAMQQMRYTAETIVKPFEQVVKRQQETINKLVEAVKVMDSKIQEATAFGGKGMSLNIPDGTFNKTPRANIKETQIEDFGSITYPTQTHPRATTLDNREKIREMNKLMNKKAL
jgi:hypothetical protein